MLQRQLGDQRVKFRPAERALLAALLHPLPRAWLQRLRLLVRPDTVLRWHRDLLARRHAAATPPWPTPNNALHPRPGAELARENSTSGDTAGCTANYEDTAASMP